MSSPKIITFFVFDGANNPQLGATPTFETYKDNTGANLAQPTIFEMGGGAYYFTPIFPSNKGIAFLIDTGHNPPKLNGYARPEDYNIDNITAGGGASQASVDAVQATVDLLLKIETNKWAIISTGPDSNRLVIYDNDGTTPLYKFDLKDSNNVATTINPFAKIPV